MRDHRCQPAAGVLRIAQERLLGQIGGGFRVPQLPCQIGVYLVSVGEEQTLDIVTRQ